MREVASKLLVGIEWKFIAAPQVNFEIFNLEVRRNIYLIYKEAINNISRHSKTKSCEILLKESNNLFSLLINDFGVGFDRQFRSRK